MKVLTYTWEYPPHISGGLGIACQGIVESLSKQGIQFSLVFPKEPSPLGAYRTYLDEVNHFASWAGALAEEQPHDLIHAHDWLTILAGIDAKKRGGKPLIFHIHSLESDRSGDFANPAIVNIEKMGFEQSDRIIAVSQVTKQNIVKFYGVSPEKIVVAYNGIWIAASATPPRNDVPRRPKKVLFMGRITHQKGPYYFLKAAEKVHAHRPDVEFIIAGTGDQTHDMILEAAQARMGSYVHFTGFLSRDEVQKIFSESSICVMPSVSEPFGIASLEALSAGLPVIISKDAGVCEVMPHVLKVDPWDTDKIASHIITLLENPALGESLVSKAQLALENLSWDHVTQPILATYRALGPRSP